MVGWHHQLNGYDFEQTLGDSGQGSLCTAIHGVAKEWNMTERLDNNPNCGLRTPLSEWFASGCGVEDNIFPKGRLPVCRVNLKTPLGPEDLNTSFPSDKGGLFGPPHIVSY